MENIFFVQLGELIEKILIVYQKICLDWTNSKQYIKINLKKKSISSIKEDENFLELMGAYRDFINLNAGMIDFIFWLDKINMIINTRVKTRNSIEFKIENYIINHEKGKIPINKCLNDLFGIRVIFPDENITQQDIQNYIKLQYPELKCIDSSKGNYKATHVYFKYNNFLFPWELQIWLQNDKENNLKSHKKYKQEYTNWETRSKEGV